MRRQIAAAVVAAASALLAPAAEAQDALALFEDFLTQEAVRIEFSQASYDNNGTLLEENEGSLSYLRPGKFRLQYNTPTHPLIISDGAVVWLYEEDLEQVVITRTAEVQKHGLWQVLALGDTAELKQRYTLAAGVGGEVRWLTATAREGGNATLQEIALGFAAEGGALRQVRIKDNLGGSAELQVTNTTFSADADDFTFIIPKGSTIIQHEETLN